MLSVEGCTGEALKLICLRKINVLIVRQATNSPETAAAECFCMTFAGVLNLLRCEVFALNPMGICLSVSEFMPMGFCF